ncbi:MAG: efflux RND transporter periplasmic adaptor subunit [Thermoanaerobaculia bacterium]
MIPSITSMDKVVEKQKGLSKKTIVLLAIAGVLILAVAALIPTIRRWSRADRSVLANQIRIGAVARGELVRDASAQGKIVASLHPTLFSPSPGIVSLSVRAGDAVKKGQLLGRVESPELRSRLLQERSTVSSLESALERQKISARQAELKNAQNIALLEVKLQAAGRLLERAQRTFAEGLLNKTDFEKAKDDLQIATLELKNAKETALLEADTARFDIRDRQLQTEREASVLNELQRQVKELDMVAPFEGVVASVAVQDRDAVAANAPIVTVVNLSAFEVEITIPENYAPDAIPGTKAAIFYEGKEYPGKVMAVSPEVRDSQLRGIVTFEGQPPAGLKQSQRVSVRLLFEVRLNVLKLPRGPFLESGAGRSVYVLDQNSVASRREITTGAVSVSEVEIVTGLTEGERVILSDTSEFGAAKSVLVRN